MSKKNVLLSAIKRASAFLLMLLFVCTFLCGCAYQRPEFDTVRITYKYRVGEQNGHTPAPGPTLKVVKKTTDPAVMGELWDMYADLKVTDAHAPQGLPRYYIEFLNRGEAVEWWRMSSNFVVNGKRFGKGNHVPRGTRVAGGIGPIFIGDSTIYNRITEIFEICDTETVE